MIFLPISILICLLDLYLKKKIEYANKKDLPRKYCNQHIIIDRSHNYGLMMNFLSGKGNFPLLLSSIAFLLVTLYSIPLFFRKKVPAFLQAGLSFILGGAFSNLYDRKKRGYVVDYISFKFKTLKNIFFNLGDFAIFLGGFFIFIFSLLSDD